jgi:hypothetical protein
MGIFRSITNGFINFFGITQPTPQQERRAAWFICSMLVLTIVAAASVFGFVVMAFGH